MWRWAESSDAFSVCDRKLDSDCARPACKVRHDYCHKYTAESVNLEAYSCCQGAGVNIPAELDPSLISFNDKLWTDVLDRLGDSES